MGSKNSIVERIKLSGAFRFPRARPCFGCRFRSRTPGPPFSSRTRPNHAMSRCNRIWFVLVRPGGACHQCRRMWTKRSRILCARTKDIRRGSYGESRSERRDAGDQNVRFDERAQTPRPSSRLLIHHCKTLSQHEIATVQAAGILRLSTVFGPCLRASLRYKQVQSRSDSGLLQGGLEYSAVSITLCDPILDKVTVRKPYQSP